MPRAFQIGAVLLLAANFGVCEQKGGAKLPKTPPASREAAKPGNPKPANTKPNGAPPTQSQGGAERNGAARGGADSPRLPNPLANPVQRMMAMSPEQRERILEKLPPQQQANIRQRLDTFDKLPPAEKARRLQLFQRFSSLPPEKQQILGRQLQAFSALPEDRRATLGKELLQLGRMPDSERQARLANDEFRSKFSAAELQMLSDISENYPFPGK
jgi:hypothetical protein